MLDRVPTSVVVVAKFSILNELNVYLTKLSIVRAEQHINYSHDDVYVRPMLHVCNKSSEQVASYQENRVWLFNLWR